MKKVEKFLKKVSEKEDLKYYINKNGDRGYCIELEYWSGLGEDVIISIVIDKLSVEDIKSEMNSYYINFDAEEHAVSLFNLQGKYGTPTSIRDLLDDADEQEKKLEQIYRTMEKINA